jgi:integrase
VVVSPYTYAVYDKIGFSSLVTGKRKNALLVGVLGVFYGVMSAFCTLLPPFTMPKRPQLDPPMYELCNGGTTLCCYVNGQRKKFGHISKQSTWEKYRDFVSAYLKHQLAPPESLTGGDFATGGALNPPHRLPAKSVTDIMSTAPVPAYKIKDLIAVFLEYVEKEYQKSQYELYRYSCKWLLDCGYGDVPVDEFTPKKFLELRQYMIDSKRLCREQINARTIRIVAMFRWGLIQEFVKKGDVYTALKAVGTLPKGKRGTFDHPEPVPVPLNVIEKTLPGLPPTLRAMVIIQFLLGLRPNEICGMRVGDIDKSRESRQGLWYFQPGSYKTGKWVGKIEFSLGKPEQELLQPYLEGKKVEEAVFSPRTAMAERNAVKRAERKTKIPPSQRKRDKERAKKPKKIAEFYTSASYRQAIEYGIKVVNQSLPDGEKIPKWAPYRLRNTAETEIELQYDIDKASALLGHRSVSMTQRYSDAQRLIRDKLAIERKNPFAE